QKGDLVFLCPSVPSVDDPLQWPPRILTTEDRDRATWDDRPGADGWEYGPAADEGGARVSRVRRAAGGPQEVGGRASDRVVVADRLLRRSGPAPPRVGDGPGRRSA